MFFSNTKPRLIKWGYVAISLFLMTGFNAAQSFLCTNRAIQLLPKIQDPQERFFATQPIVTSLIRQEKMEQAYESLTFFRDAKLSAAAVRILEQSATALVDEKRVTTAIHLIQFIQSPSEKYLVAQRVLFGLLQPDSLDIAAQIPELVPQTLSQSRLISILADYYISEKNDIKTKETISQVQDATEKEALLTRLGKIQAEQGKVQETWITVRGIQNQQSQSEILESLALHLIKAGNYDDAILCSSYSLYPLSKLWITQKESIKLAKQNQWSEAVAMAKDIPNPDIRADTFYFLASFKLQEGNEAQAEQLINLAPKTKYTQGCQLYCEELSNNGKLDGCLKIINRLATEEAKRTVFLNIANYLGKHAEYQDALLYIKQWPDNIKDEAYGQFLEGWTSEQQFNLNKARTLFSQISESSTIVKTMFSILDTLIEKNPTETIILVQDTLPQPFNVTTLLNLSKKLKKTQPNLSKQAEQYCLERCQKLETKYRLQICLTIANDLSKSGSLSNKDHPIIRQIRQDIDRAEVIVKPNGKLQLAKIYIQMGCIEESADLYQQLPDYMKAHFLASVPENSQDSSRLLDRIR